MTSSNCANDIALPASQGEDSQDEVHTGVSSGPSKSLKGLLMWFAVTVTVGLSLASWYVGVRIVAADEVSTPAASAPVPAPAQLPAPVQATATLQVAPAAQPIGQPTVRGDSKAEAFWYTVPPAHLYLEAAGIGPRQDAGFVRSLQARGFHAQVQDGERSDNARILIGPFSTHAEMEQAQRKLQSAGVLAVEMAR
jgi:cell division septation protein DedD